jgi:hypothetical protein
MKSKANPASAHAPMRVKVVLTYFQGRALFKDNPKLKEVYEGHLKIREDRLHKHGRMVLVARLMGSDDGKEVVVAELNDVLLLWMDKRRMRLRGFEYVGDTEYAQVWDIEFV